MTTFVHGFDFPPLLNRSLVLIAILSVFCCLPTTMLAQGDETPTSDTATMITGEISADEVNEVARELWCPLCSGVRLDGCELKACDQMKDEIALKLESGEDLDSIKNYFVAQYGPQVLGEPPREGFNLLAWILPIVALLGGGLFLLTRGRKLFRSNEPEQQPVVVGEDGEAVDDEGSIVSDPYVEQLEKELKQYD